MFLRKLLAWRSAVAFRKALAMTVEVQLFGDSVLGKRNARLLHSYGRIMNGPNTGLYVSGISPAIERAYIETLSRGEEIEVHLMHRHRSGNYESSRLRLVDGKLVMRFDDREELA